VTSNNIPLSCRLTALRFIHFELCALLFIRISIKITAVLIFIDSWCV